MTHDWIPSSWYKDYYRCANCGQFIYEFPNKAPKTGGCPGDGS